VDPVTLGIIASSVLSGIFGNRKQETQQTSRQESHQDSTSTPNFDSESNYLKNFLINSYLDRLQDNGDDYWNAQKRTGLQNLNRAEDNSNNILRQFMTSRGLGLTGAGASMAGQSAVTGQFNKANFLNQIPILRDQRQQENLTGASRFFSTIPYGMNSTQHGTQNTVGTGTQPGNMMGGGFTGLAASLAQLYGMGAFGNQQPRGVFGTDISRPDERR
jgi:hypothetical protein